MTLLGLCCRLLIGKILGAIGLMFVFVLIAKEPECYITSFIVPELNKTLNATNNPAIAFTVEFDNGNKFVGIGYNNINFTVGVFLDRNTTSPIGSSTISRFYQGMNNNKEKWSSIETHTGALNRTVKVDGKTYFRVNFTTMVKYELPPFHRSRHKLWGGANIAFNDSGLKDEKDKIRLGHSLPVIIQSSAHPLAAGCYRVVMVLGFLVHFVPLGLFL